MRALYDVAAPAKLNLFLHITGRRADGYHLLQSAFTLIDWCDTLYLELRAGGRISREDAGAALPPDDLIVRAACALQAATGCTAGAHIRLEKRIPMQAGMGGGSSDAASALLALNRLWRLNLPAQTLAQIGLGLGADVPFFLHGRAAWAEGIGEKLQTLPLPPARFWVVKPPGGLDTAQIFRTPDLKRDTKPAIVPPFVANPFAFGKNDLQPVAERINPQVAQAIKLLQSAGLNPRMTGSGSAVFAVIGKDWKGPFPVLPEGWQARECSRLEMHPLLRWHSSKVQG